MRKKPTPGCLNDNINIKIIHKYVVFVRKTILIAVEVEARTQQTNQWRGNNDVLMLVLVMWFSTQTYTYCYSSIDFFFFATAV